MKQQIEIKGEEDRATVAKTLFNNGYTVRKAVLQKPNSKTKTTVLEYWKGEVTDEQIEKVWEYEKYVEELNCIHSDEHGVCELLSDDTAKGFCPLCCCPDFQEAVKEQ